MRWVSTASFSRASSRPRAETSCLAAFRRADMRRLIEPCGKGHLRIIKLAAKPYEKTNFKTRILWTLKINTRIVLGLWSELRSCDEIRFTGSPPLLLHWIAPLNILLRKRLVYRITDFHPECLIAARGRPSWWLSLIYRLTLFWRRRVTAFEVLGEDQKARLIEIGIEEERIRVKPDRSPVVINEATVPLERPEVGAGQSAASLFWQLGRRP